MYLGEGGWAEAQVAEFRPGVWVGCTCWGEKYNGVALSTVWKGGMETPTIEAEWGVANIYHTASTGGEHGIKWGGDSATEAFNPELAANEVTPSYSEDRADLSRIPMSPGGEVLVDLYGRIREVAGERGKKCV